MAGTSLVVTWVDVPPPQDARKKQPKSPKNEHARDLTAATLPMNAFQEEINLDRFRKTLSVEAAHNSATSYTLRGSGSGY